MKMKDSILNVIEVKYPNLPDFPLTHRKVEKAGYKFRDVLKDMEIAIKTADDYEDHKEQAEPFLKAMIAVK